MGTAVVALEVTVLEPLMLVTTLVIMLTLAGDEECDDEDVSVPPEDELVDPPALFRVVGVALLDGDWDPDKDDAEDDGGGDEDEDEGGEEEEDEGGAEDKDEGGAEEDEEEGGELELEPDAPCELDPLEPELEPDDTTFPSLRGN